MKLRSVQEARAQFSSLLDGTETTFITRHGKVVAKLIPMPASEEGEVVKEVPMPDAKPGSWAARHPRQAAIDKMLKKPTKP